MNDSLAILIARAMSLPFRDRFVAQDKTSSGKLVSTVLLPFDHGTEGASLWFETMVFHSPEDFLDIDCDRYETRAQAVVGHGKMLEKWRDQ